MKKCLTSLLATIILQSESSTSCNSIDNGDDQSCLAEEKQIIPEPPSKLSIPRDGPVPATFRNNCQYRADIYFDDGWFGEIVGTAEANGGEVKIDTFPFLQFFVAMHGEDLLPTYFC